MDDDERENLMTGTHIALLSVVESPDRAPLSRPVWCDYQPGGVLRFSTATDLLALEAVRREGRATLTIQENLVPYRAVAVEGTVLIYEPTDPDELRRWMSRCLGDRIGDRYYRSVEDEIKGMTTIVLRPERWHTYGID